MLYEVITDCAIAVHRCIDFVDARDHLAQVRYIEQALLLTEKEGVITSYSIHYTKLYEILTLACKLAWEIDADDIADLSDVLVPNGEDRIRVCQQILDSLERGGALRSNSASQSAS